MLAKENYLFELDADLKVLMFPCLKDNYGYLVHHESSGHTACIDTPDANEIIAQCEKMDWQVTHILNTHHHFDHAGGNEKVKNFFNATVYGFINDKERIPEIDVLLEDLEELNLLGSKIKIFHTPGHTLGHIVYHFPEAKVIFVGDTLFSLGCGRVFEGTMTQMWDSLSLFKKLDPNTIIFCAHEYTESNAKFACYIDPDNENLKKMQQKINNLRKQNMPTLPTTVKVELDLNPFLGNNFKNIAQNLGIEGASPEAIFARVRTEKDRF